MLPKLNRPSEIVLISHDCDSSSVTPRFLKTQQHRQHAVVSLCDVSLAQNHQSDIGILDLFKLSKDFEPSSKKIVALPRRLDVPSIFDDGYMVEFVSRPGPARGEIEIRWNVSKRGEASLNEPRKRPGLTWNEIQLV